MGWVVFVGNDAQRTCVHEPVTLIEQALWDEMICPACNAAIFNLAAFDADDMAELARVAQEEGFDFEIKRGGEPWPS